MMLTPTKLCIFVVPPGLFMTTEAQNHANRRNAPKTHRPPNKPPNQPKLSTNYDSIITNKANFPDDQMNVSAITTKDYENISNCKLCENKPNSNPTCRGVASGEAGFKANTKPIKANKMPKRTQYKPNTNPIKPNL